MPGSDFHLEKCEIISDPINGSIVIRLCNIGKLFLIREKDIVPDVCIYANDREIIYV